MLFGTNKAIKTVAMTAKIAKIELQTKSLSKINQLGIYFSSFSSVLGITTPKSVEISSSSVFFRSLSQSERESMDLASQNISGSPTTMHKIDQNSYNLSSSYLGCHFFCAQWRA